MKIGFLFPYSGVFPDLKEDFRQGFELALAANDRPTYLEEFIQNGDQKSVDDALKKLVHFERVDLVAGIVGNLVTANCIPLVEKAQAPMLVNNLGAHFPGRQLSSPFLFYNSLHLWKSEWSMGKWAQATYGGVPAISLSLYEAGYHLHECFKNGTGASGAEQLTLNIMRREEGAADPKPLVTYLEEQRPRHTHLLVSGPEAIRFMEYLDASPVKGEVALTSHPFLNADVRYACTWAPNLDTPENRLFTQHYAETYKTPPNAYTLLGYESGLGVAAALDAIDGKPTRARLTEALGSVRPNGPRGPIALSTRPLRAEQPVYLCRGDKTLEVLPAITVEDPVFEPLQDIAAGWLNPYLCV